MAVTIEISAEFADYLAEFGRLPTWSESNRDAIRGAVESLHGDWLERATRSGSDPLGSAKPQHDDPFERHIRDASRFFRAPSVHARADQLAAAIDEYFGGAWQRDRVLSTCPPRYAGTVREFFWRALRVFPFRPDKQRIYTILMREK